MALADPGGAWDKEVGGDLHTQCKEICAEFRQARSIRFPRSVLGEGDGVVLLVFADASTVALAATIYARVESSGSYKCTLVAARTKVAPARHVSIPRLELTAAVMAVQLAQVVQSAMLVRPTEVWYFTVVDQACKLC